MSPTQSSLATTSPYSIVAVDADEFVRTIHDAGARVPVEQSPEWARYDDSLPGRRHWRYLLVHDAAGAHVVPADFSLGMLREGKKRRADLGFTAADATKLPFADASFDAVTMSFGLRNVVDVTGALAEFARVTKPGGRLLICEFSHPTNGPFRRVYTEYLMQALPPVARAVSSNPESYVYLAESIQSWPAQRELAELIKTAGWADVEWRNLTGGIVALHRAVKPAAKNAPKNQQSKNQQVKKKGGAA